MYSASIESPSLLLIFQYGEVIKKPKSQILTSEGERVDLGGGFASRAVMARWVAVSRWFKRQRSGSRRLIFVKSSWVRPSSWGCLVGFSAVIGSEAEEEMEK
ncbi:hypothetical protein PS1_029838 [Malus domestica]